MGMPLKRLALNMATKRYRTGLDHDRYWYACRLVLSHQRLCLIRFINSSRVLACWKKPVKSEVVVKEFCFSTPRICIHICCASITTITPNGSKVLWMQSLICIVIRSCIWRRRAKISTTLGILLKPVIYFLGIWFTWPCQRKATYDAHKGRRNRYLSR